MNPINLTDFAKDLEPLTGVWVDMGYGRYGNEYSKIFKVVNKKGAYVEDAMHSSLGALQQKREGDAIRYDKFTQKYVKRYTPTAYALGCAITHEQLEDGVALDVAQQCLTDLGRSAADCKNTVAYDVIARAFTAAYAGADGKELCATDHPTDEGTTSNELATPASLSEASLKQAMIEMKAMKDLRGNRRQVSARKLVVPKELIWDAEILVKSVNRTGTADNDINPVNSLGIFPGGVVSSDWLSSTTNYFILTDRDERGLIFMEHTPLLTKRDGDFDTMNAKFMVYTRFDAGWTDYNCIFGVAI